MAKADDARLPARSQILTPHTELRSMFLIEPERGCSRGCTYCVMRRTTNGGMRMVTPERVLALVPAARAAGGAGRRRGHRSPAAAGDAPRPWSTPGREVGISSLRADRLTDELVGLLPARRLPDPDHRRRRGVRAAARRHRAQDQARSTSCAPAQLARKHGLRQLKLYMMVGLPGETEERTSTSWSASPASSPRSSRVSYGVAPFVAKRNTPLDGAPFAGISEVDTTLAYLRKKLRGRAEVRATSARWAWVEYMLAQGGADAGLSALDAHRAGGDFAAWKRAFRDRGVTPGLARRVEDGRREPPRLALWPTVGP